MEIQNNKPVTVTFSDGTVKQVIYDSFNVSNEGFVTLQGHLCDLPTEPLSEEPKESVDVPTDRPFLRQYSFRSGLIRFLFDGRMQTAAVTHATDKAWRILNNDLGVAWIPKNVIRWSEIAQQFCIVDEDYQLDFTFDVVKGMDEYPVVFNPDDLVINELD